MEHGSFLIHLLQVVVIFHTEACYILVHQETDCKRQYGDHGNNPIHGQGIADNHGDGDHCLHQVQEILKHRQNSIAAFTVCQYY